MESIKNKISVSYFCPAYNEEENLEDLIRQGLSTLSEICGDFEMIVVNNGSHDGTGRILSRLSFENPRLRYIHLKKNVGYGGALEAGFKEARFENIVYTDADLQYDISDLKNMIPMLDSCDVVNGFRKNRSESLPRKTQSHFFNWLTNVIFKLKLKDINCSFKLYKKRVIDTIDMNIISKSGYFVDGEMLAKAKWAGFKIREVPVSHKPRERGRGIAGNPPRMFLCIAKTLIDMAKVYHLKKFKGLVAREPTQ